MPAGPVNSGNKGRVAQWESARFTRERSQVRNPPRPWNGSACKSTVFRSYSTGAASGSTSLARSVAQVSGHVHRHCNLLLLTVESRGKAVRERAMHHRGIDHSQDGVCVSSIWTARLHEHAKGNSIAEDESLLRLILVLLVGGKPVLPEATNCRVPSKTPVPIGDMSHTASGA